MLTFKLQITIITFMVLLIPSSAFAQEGRCDYRMNDWPDIICHKYDIEEEKYYTVEPETNETIPNYPYVGLQTPTITIDADSFDPDSNEMDFRIEYVYSNDYEIGGLVVFYRDVVASNVDSFNLDSSMISLELKNENENTINPDNYNVVSTGKTEVTSVFEPEGNTMSDYKLPLTNNVVEFEEPTMDYLYDFYLKPYLDYGVQNPEFDIAEAEYIAKSMAENKLSDDNVKKIMLTDVLSPREYQHKITNTHVYGNPSIILEGKIKSEIFEYGKTFTFEVTSGNIWENSHTFTLNEPVIEEITPEETPDPIVEEKPVIVSEQVDATEYTVPKEKPVSVIPEKTGLASFVDSSKDPQYYVDRYNNEANYKKWFDDNYSQYDSIYTAVGLDPADAKQSTQKTTTNHVMDSEPTTKSATEEIKCGRGMELNNGICVFAGPESGNEPQCGRGMIAENGICVFDRKESPGFFDSIFSVFSGLFK